MVSREPLLPSTSEPDSLDDSADCALPPQSRGDGGVQVPDNDSKSRGELSVPDFPWLREARDFLAGLDGGLEASEHGVELWLLVMCIRWTHDGINSNMTFKLGGSVFAMVHRIWKSGKNSDASVGPMEVVLSEDGRLWSLSNRRLAAFKMIQALSAETIWARCCIYTPSHHKFRNGSLTTKNGGLGVSPNFGAPRKQPEEDNANAGAGWRGRG